MENKMSACGMFANRKSAQQAIDLLKQQGFKMSDISILARKKDGPHNFVHGQKTKIRDGAIIGALIGFLLLGFIGFILSYYNMTMAESTNGIPGQSQFSSRLLLLDTVLGLSLGAMIGAACGALTGIGIPNSISKRYKFYLNQGGLLLIVHEKSREDYETIVGILKKTGAQDIGEMYDAEVWELAIIA